MDPRPQPLPRATRLLSSGFSYLLLVSALLIGGCSGGHEKLEAEMDNVKDEMIRVQAENDSLDERIMALEQSRIAAAGKPQARESESERPPLEVVKLVPVVRGEPSEPEGAGSVQPAGTQTNP